MEVGISKVPVSSVEVTEPYELPADALRKHFARELHDQVAQPLISLVLQVHDLQERVGGAEAGAVAAELKELEESGRQILRSAREMLIDLRGTGNLRLNFVEALRNELRTATPTHQFELAVSSRWPKHINGWAAFNLLRIAKQAVNNAARHGHATSVDIFLDHNPDGEAVLVVLDDGGGMNGEPAGLGILGMQERATILGGSFNVSALETGGTRIEVRVPMHRIA